MRRRGLIDLIRSGRRADGGFTLIELLVVIIIIAVLAAIAIPTFLGQRQRAQDTAAYTLVRNALTAVQAVFVDTNDYTEVTAAALTDAEPSIVFLESAADLVGVAPAFILDPLGADARLNEVAFFPESENVIDLASVSASGNSFGIQVDTLNLVETGYVEVKVIDGSAELGW